MSRLHSSKGFLSCFFFCNDTALRFYYRYYYPLKRKKKSLTWSVIMLLFHIIFIIFCFLFFRLFISYGMRPGHFGKCTPAPFWRRDLYFSLVTQFHTEKANTVTSGFQANRMTLMMRGFLVQSSAGVAVVSILYPVFCYQMIYTDIYRATEPGGCVQYH